MTILVVMLIIILLITLSVEIDIKILKNNTNDEVVIEVKTLYGLIKYKKEFPLVKLEIEDNELAVSVNEETEVNMNSKLVDEKNKSFDIDAIKHQLKTSMKIMNKYKEVLKYCIKKTIWKTLEWDTEIGLDDAAVTGFLAGAINIIKTNIFVFIKNNEIYFKKVYLNAQPNFNSLSIKTSLNCIFSIKIGYIIIAGIKMIKIKLIGS